MIDAFARIRDDPTIGCALLTGAGDKAFCSGGDQRFKDRGGYVGGDGLARLNVLDLQRQIRSLPIPVIALVNGYAIGGGQVLQVVCDLAIAGDNAIFGQVGPQVGSFDAGFGIGLLARLVGDRKAKEIWFLCRRYDAAAALDMGLVNHVVPLADLEAEGITVGRRDPGDEPDRDPLPEVGVPRRHRRAGRPAGVRGQRDRPVLHDRRGARGLDGLPREAQAGLLAVPAPPVTTATTARPSTFRIWLLAIRPATLPAALSGVVVGLGAALAVGTPFRLDTAIGCLAVALLLQITANLSNDLSDFRKGADTPARTGPVRVAAAGLVTPRQLEIAIAIVIGLAGVVGLWLTTVGGPVLLVVGVLAVVAALAYTGGPWAYGYRGLGEVFVFLFFGFVAVVGTAYLQAGRVEPLFWVAAVPVGALTTAILVVNNLRDIPTDRRPGSGRSRSMLGVRRTRLEYAGAPAGRVRGAGGARGGRARAAGPPARARTADRVAAAADRPDLHRAAPAEPRAQGHGPARARLRAAVRGRAGDRGRDRMTAVRTLVADRVRIPFRRPFATATGMWVEREAWILRLVDADGRVGLGEAVLEPANGEVAETILTALVRETVEGAAGGLPIAGRPGDARGARAGAGGGARERPVRPRGRRRPARTRRASA